MSLIIQSVLGYGILVLIPFLHRTVEPDPTGRRFSLLWMAAGAGALSLFFTVQSHFGIFFAVLWLLWCIGNSITKFLKFLIWGQDHFGVFLNFIASVLLVGGSIWLLSTRFSFPFLGFGEPWKTLTAVHFHFSGFLLVSVFAVYRDKVRNCSSILESKIYIAFNCFYLFGFVLVAIGLTGLRTIELWGTSVLFCSALVNLYLLLKSVWKDSLIYDQAVILCIGVSGFISFSLALMYSWRIFPTLNVHWMILTHGILNAFLLLPLLFYLTDRQKIRFPVRKFSFSKIRSNGKIESDFFHSYLSEENQKEGLTDDFSEFRREDFDPDLIHPSVRNFYESTNKYELNVKVAPNRFFRFTWKFLVKPFFAKLQQLNLPDKDKKILGTINSISCEKDGRPSPRGWMRVDAETGKPIYAAAYSMHKTDRTTYMNIAFPLPYFNMTSVLHIEYSDRPSGIQLTTIHTLHPLGDQGVYLVFAGLGVRLPLDETIEVWFDQGLKARHKMWFLGWHYLTLDYTMDLKHK
ncbi:membrane protein [Leptospira kobayashii]|uniref:Membrane protein n=1 Tax=Leptospira kobayashii TaxID=1917830 RepID=A0ABN6KE21_9LEPT|nr:YndJ family transporter [Leptospira kobayashii]BDA79238.1 membrane protein [Leptospira kobayashii]